MPIAGPSFEGGNPVASGIVHDIAGKPVANASVVAHKILNRLAGDTLDIVRTTITAKTWSKSDGSFTLYDLHAGRYYLEGVAPDSSGYARSSIVLVSGNDSTGSDLDTLVLRTPGSIHGVVTRSGISGTSSNALLRDGFIEVVVGEINRSVTTGPDGTYLFDDIAQGDYTLVFYADDGFFTTYRESITVISDRITVVDTVRLQRIPWLAPPKPLNLTLQYDTISSVATLNWRAPAIIDLLGFEIERIRAPMTSDTIFATTDSFFVDSLNVSPQDSVHLLYVVRSVNQAFMRSANEGPVELVLPLCGCGGRFIIVRTIFHHIQGG